VRNTVQGKKCSEKQEELYKKSGGTGDSELRNNKRKEG
jgi:hypothetical protein